MNMNKAAEKYVELLREVHNKIPKDEMKRVLNQDSCDIDPSFLGFLKIYDLIRQFVPTHYSIIDLGCAYAAQAFLLDNYISYVGVDVCDVNERFDTRFALCNNSHYVLSIQDFISKYSNQWQNVPCFAVCSYVPDSEAREMVFKTFDDVLVYYPGIEPKLKFNGNIIDCREQIEAFLDGNDIDWKFIADYFKKPLEQLMDSPQQNIVKKHHTNSLASLIDEAQKVHKKQARIRQPWQECSR